MVPEKKRGCMTSRRKRIASLAIGLLATTMALACGSSSDDEASGSASTGSGNSTGGYCTTAAPGCLIETKLEKKKRRIRVVTKCDEYGNKLNVTHTRR